jgi:hypothetical protein
MRRFLTAVLVCACFTGIAATADAQEPILLRLDAPVGRITKYRTQTQSWLQGFPTDPTKPSMVKTDVTTESVTEVEGDVRTMSTVLDSDQLDVDDTDAPLHAKNTLRGQTTVSRIDSRGRVLSSKVTREADAMRGQPPAASHAGGEFTLPDGPVRIGDTWAATERMSMGPGTGGMHGEVQVTYKLQRVDLAHGARVAVISMNGAIVTWLEPVGLRGQLKAIPNAAPDMSSVSGELRLDLDASRMVGLTVNIENRWGTSRGHRTRMTRIAQ